MTTKRTDWYYRPDFSKEELELNTMEIELNKAAPKDHKLASTKIDEIKRKIGNQLGQAHAGTCGFVRGAIQDKGNIARPFFNETLFKDYPTRANVEQFLKLVKQDYSFALARYFSDLLTVVYEDIFNVINPEG